MTESTVSKSSHREMSNDKMHEMDELQKTKWLCTDCLVDCSVCNIQCSKLTFCSFIGVFTQWFQDKHLLKGNLMVSQSCISQTGPTNCLSYCLLPSSYSNLVYLLISATCMYHWICNQCLN